MQQDVDANSCYYSASASHTDNYCSTDEHDPLILNVGLHSSDSGADISEYQLTTSSHIKDIPLCGPRKLRKPEEQLERNNSLPEAFGVDEYNQSWDKFWSENGERLIWASWIELYSDYINPEYVKLSQNDDKTPSNVRQQSQKSNFSFDPADTEYKNVVNTTDTEIVVSSCSPAANENGEEGWNPLSPASIEDTWHAHRNRNYDIENLLSPRCESVTSSIPLTIGTTDSMTNVTQMTISSYDFGGSSRISSVSSQLSESISSSDMITSSSSSSSQLPESLDESKIALLAEDDTMDSDEHWQILWQKHFQEQYAKQYRLFMVAQQQRRISFDLSTSLRCESAVPLCNKTDGDNFPKIKTNKRKRIVRNNREVISSDHLPKLVSNLNLQSMASGECKELPSPHDGNSKNSETNTTKKETAAADGGEANDFYVDRETLASMGLPTRFGGRSKGAAGSGGDRPPDDRPINLKRR